MIFAGGGDDDVSALGARDLVCGGGGNDTIRGGRGNDRAFGQAGDDRLVGGIGNDRLRGGAGGDDLEGGRSNDYVNGEAGDGDFADGGLGDDRVFGGGGDGDHVAGWLGIDRVNGGPGAEDLVHGDYGWDRMIGGPGGGDIGSFFTAVSGQQGPGQEMRPPGIRASLRRGLAIGDGRDVLRSLESLEGSAFDDVLTGRGAGGTVDGGRGSDRCRGFASTRSCGKGRRGGATVLVDRSQSRLGTLTLLGGARRDVLRLTTDHMTGAHTIRSRRPLALGPGCTHPAGKPRLAVCTTQPGARHRTIDLGAGNDRLVIADSQGLEGTRVGAWAGDDEIHGGPAGELIEAGEGADRLFGGGGSDGLVGGVPGRDLIAGQGEGDLLAAGGACIGGALVGGPGRDNASFAEAPGHPGVMHASLKAGRALVRALPGCRPVRLHRSNEDLEGTFDWDILIGDGRGNALLGQPGRDRFYGLGGRDQINAFDHGRDFRIDCGAGGGVLLADRRDPRGIRCEEGDVIGPPAELPRALPPR